MWIVTPRLTSLYAPDAGALISGYEELSHLFAQYFMWRSKPSTAPTWLRRCKTTAWMKPLSGLILNPSLWKGFETRYLQSLEVIHVSPSHFVGRGRAKATRMADISGRIAGEQFELFDLSSVSGKMLKDTSRWDCPRLSATWKKMVTAQRGDYSQRKLMLKHRTKGSVSSSSDCERTLPPKYSKTSVQNWPTPTTQDWRDGSVRRREDNLSKGGNHSVSLQHKVHAESLLWPTPRAGNPGSRKPGTGGKVLEEEARNWITPRANDAKNSTYYMKDGKKAGLYLCGQVTEKNWPTPIVGDAHLSSTKEAAKQRMKEGKTTLSRVVALEKNWPTPTTSDHKGSGPKVIRDDGITRMCRLDYAVEQSGQPDQGSRNTGGNLQEQSQSVRLNPRWVETLLGLPVGWVMPSCTLPVIIE